MPLPGRRRFPAHAGLVPHLPAAIANLNRDGSDQTRIVNAAIQNRADRKFAKLPFAGGQIARPTELRNGTALLRFQPM